MAAEKHTELLPQQTQSSDCCPTVQCRLSLADAVFFRRLQLKYAALEATLGEKEAEVWSMSRHKGMKYAEIAAALGISVRTVEDRIARAKNHFRRTLDRYWSIVLFLFLFMD